MRNDNIVREYLLPAYDTFWEWRDDGEVITWKNDKTIAFRDELQAVLAWLAPQGLPSLNSIALVLSATHDDWNSSGGEARSLSGVFRQPPETVPHLREILGGLERIHRLPPNLRTSVRAKSVLAEYLLSKCRRDVEPEEALSVVEAMHHGIGEIVAPDAEVRSRGYGPLMLTRDFIDMLSTLERLEEENIRLALATGLDELPDPADLELSPSQSVRALIDTLQDDRELAGLARAAKQLLAIASLPRRLHMLERHHTGGFSDIANRGSIDRLLISELANDDLTLAVRVAMNEALYLRREVPPSTPRHHRSILIDAGIRSWGVPRIFAVAAALAFLAGTTKGSSCSCYRANCDAIEPIDLLSRIGLKEHLGKLRRDLSPAAALPAFFQQLGDDPQPVEPILLMPEESLADDAVTRALHQADFPQLFVATVNRTGVFRLVECGRYGTRLLREAKIEIDELFRERPPLLETRAVAGLPAIFHARPFPLFLSHNVDWHRTFYVQEFGAFSTTRDGRLLRWRARGLGAQEVSDNIVGRILWISPVAVEQHVTMVVGGSSNASVLRIDDENHIVDSIRLRQRTPGEIYCARNGVLFMISSHFVDVLDMHSGEVLETLKLPAHVRWKRDRFFCGTRAAEWYALGHDGRTARLEPVTCAGQSRELPPLIAMFDQRGVDGPVGVTRQGNLLSTVSGETRAVKHGLSGEPKVPWISGDGHRLQLKSSTAMNGVTPTILLNTESLECKKAYYDQPDDRAQSIVWPTNLRHRFKAIGLDDAGNLALETRTGSLIVFTIRQGLPVLTPQRTRVAMRARRSFEPLSLRGRRYSLWQAKWGDGSRAVLDSRGLLHLASGDRSIPEVTLVLSEGELSGWCLDSRTWGVPYFVGEGKKDKGSAAKQSRIFATTVGKFAERINA